MTINANVKKIIAIAILAVLIPIVLFILVVAVHVFLGNEENVTQSALSILFLAAIFLAPLIWAYQTLKNQRAYAHLNSQNTTVAADASLTFQAKIELADYRKLMFIIWATNPMFIFISIMFFGTFIFQVAAGNIGWWGYFTLFFLLYMPIAVYRSASTNYKSTKAINETLTYECTASAISVTGETFSSHMQWSMFHKRRELRNWFLLYTNNQVALLIPKSVLASQKDMELFRAMIAAIRPH